MSYQRGDPIRASDFNAFYTTVSSVYGTGYGDRGYGALLLGSTVNTGDVINAASWTALTSMLSTCITQQGSTTLSPSLPQNSLFVSGSTLVRAHNSNAPTSDAYDFNIVATGIDTNRLTVDSSNLVLTPNVLVNAVGAAWSTTIDASFDVNFGSEDAARYFFNSGGKIRFSARQPNVVSAQDTDWQNILVNKVGYLTLGAHSLASTGNLSIGSSIGYYELTDTPQIVFNGSNIGSGAYSANDVLIYAQRGGYVGTRSGNGSLVRIRIVLNDDHTNTFFDSVTAGTTFAVDTYRSSVFAISQPAVNLVKGF